MIPFTYVSYGSQNKVDKRGGGVRGSGRGDNSVVLIVGVHVVGWLIDVLVVNKTK
jgi:hypothetical protein